MTEIHSSIINDKLNKKNKTQTVVLIISLLIGLGFLIWGLNIINQKLPEAKNLFDIAASGSLEEGTYTYLNMVDEPYLFAEKDDSSIKYYFVTDADNYSYIIYIDEETYQELSNQSKLEEVKKITGITKKIDNEIKSIAIDVLNDEYDMEINSSNFTSYFGNVYLDVVNRYYEADVEFMIAGIFLIGALIVFLVKIINKNRIKKLLNKYPQSEWDKIEAELNVPEIVFNNNIYFTKNYLIVFNNFIDVINYEEIVWTYFIHHTYNGISTNRQVILYTDDRKMHAIQDFAAFSKKRKNQVEELINLIGSKNENILIGYNEENRQEAIKRYKS